MINQGIPFPARNAPGSTVILLGIDRCKHWPSGRSDYIPLNHRKPMVMLEGSFIFLERVSRATEQRLWDRGVTEWDRFLSSERIEGIGRKRKAYYELRLRQAKRALLEKDIPFLAGALPRNEHWRLFELCAEEALYVDIETAERYGDITVLGAWDGKEYYSFVKGCNLEKSLVQRLFSRHRLFVTFNGSSFDLPIIERYFGGVLPEGYLHVDLRHLCARLDLHGGLKTIERIRGLRRDGEIDGMTGEEAALLWHEYLLTGDTELVELLLAYNEADCRNLEPLAAWAVEELWRRMRSGSTPGLFSTPGKTI